jgi:hypothetical protein
MHFLASRLLDWYLYHGKLVAVNQFQGGDYDETSRCMFWACLMKFLLVLKRCAVA